MNKTRHLLASLALLASFLFPAATARAEERILWYSIGDGLTNTANIQAAVNFAVANRFTAICYLSRYRANAYYFPNRDFSANSNPEPRVSTAVDGLQFAIDRGHEAGLRVYAAFGCFLVTENSDTLPSHIPAGWVTWRYQDTVAPVAANDTTYNPDPGYPRQMTAADGGEGLWVDPGIAAVRNHTRSVLRDLVQNYDVDGIILDRIRYPGDELPHRSGAYGYNPTALAEMGAGATPGPGASAFITARRNAVTTFITDAAADLRALKPWVIFGSAPIVYGSTLSDTYNSVFQHFPSWNSASNPGHASGFGNMDFIAPQYYRTVSSTNATLMNLVNTDIDEVARMFHLATFSTGSNAGVVAQGICDTRQKGMQGWGIFAYTGTSNATYISSLTTTSTTPCGSGIISAATTPVDFTLKTGWDSVKPNSVTTLAASTPVAGQVVLTWNTPPAASDGDVPVRYLVYRSSTSPVKLYYSNLVNRNFDVKDNSFADKKDYGLTAGTKYYRVIPVDDYNNKGGSNEVSAVPVIPTAIVESRTAAGATTPSPGYAETGTFGATTAKSAAPGLTGSGARYSTVVGNRAKFQPAIPSAGTYDVFVTLANNANGPSNDANTSFTVFQDGAPVGGNVRLRAATSGLADQWLLIAAGVKMKAGAAGAAGGIEFQNLDGDGTASTYPGNRFCMDAVKFEASTGWVSVWDDDTFPTGSVGEPGAATGWSSFGLNSALAFPSYDGTQGAYRAHVTAATDRFRNSGLIANASEWMPYSVVGPTNCVRAKFFIYAGGQANPGQSNQIPNMRLRVQTRFAVNSMFELTHHSNPDPEQDAISVDLRPSTNPAKPSLYRVDMDPVDVPYLQQNPTVEGFQRAFEAVSLDPQDNGFVGMTESVIGAYPSSATPDTAAPVKVYAVSASDAGDLKLVQASENLLFNYVSPPAEAGEGALGTSEFTGPVPTVAEGPGGITLDTAGVPLDRIGIASRNINPDRGTNDYAARVRVEPGRQYRVRFHLTSTRQTNQQASIRLRARTVKFAWNQKFELSGAWATDASKTYPLNANNTIAQQALPGVGNQNPDRTGNENGGWYSLILHTPLSPEVRAEFADGVPLATRMPNLAAQPGPGVNAFSRRDIQVGFDLLDSISFGQGAPLEQGNVTLDRIEVRAYNLVPD